MGIDVEPIGRVRANRTEAEDDYWGGSEACIELDGTPVLDIKPVMREFLPRGAVRQPAWSGELMRLDWERSED